VRDDGRSSESAATVEHEGTKYFFCRQGCATKFRTDPQKYLAPKSPAAPAAPLTQAERQTEYICPTDPEVHKRTATDSTNGLGPGGDYQRQRLCAVRQFGHGRRRQPDFTSSCQRAGTRFPFQSVLSGRNGRFDVLGLPAHTSLGSDPFWSVATAKNITT